MTYARQYVMHLILWYEECDLATDKWFSALQ